MRNQVHYVLQLLSLLRFHLLVFNVSSLSLLILSWKPTVCPKLYITESSSKSKELKGAQNHEDLDLPDCTACSLHSIFGSDHSCFLHLEGSSSGPVTGALLMLSRISKQQKMPSPSWSPPQRLLPIILRYTASNSSAMLHNKPQPY